MSAMIDNTPENQEKFLHQYHGQRILYINNLDKKPLPVSDEYVRHIYTLGNNVVAELTPLSQITDEHAIELANIIGYTTTNDHKIMSIRYMFYGVKYSPEFPLGSRVADYLRSKGYALPWMGISVETLIEWGWLKLKEGHK